MLSNTPEIEEFVFLAEFDTPGHAIVGLEIISKSISINSLLHNVVKCI
jgi:hypothetical protein